MKTISISGQPFEISAPYTAGHVLTEAEAKSLNQTRAENIGNNFRTAVKKAIDENKLDEVKDAIAKYDAEYAFSMTQARTPIDPLEAEAFKIAKEFVKNKIAEKTGKTVKAYLEIDGNQAKYDANVEKIAAQEDTIKEAKKRLAAKKKIAELDGGGLDL